MTCHGRMGAPPQLMGQSAQSDKGYLDGKVLIAMPGMEDQRFARSVIYVCAHSEDGAMGIVLNQVADQVSFEELLVQLDIIDETEAAHIAVEGPNMVVHRGGPVETGRGFVLHSADFYLANSTLPINDDVCLTATLDILKAIADGEGPKKAILALGYSGWAPGQLEAEIQANGWLHGPADPDLLFGADLDAKYNHALRNIGIEPAMLSAESGHA